MDFKLHIRDDINVPLEDIRTALANFAAGYGSGNTYNAEGHCLLWSDTGWFVGNVTAVK
jgi:hypothetical protein